MATFFTKIQSYFATEYHGRYLEKILEALSEMHPEILCEFVYLEYKMNEAEHFTNPSFTTEFVYKYKDGGNIAERIADLAILDNNIPKVLIEIKFQDQEIKGKNELPDQFEDYVRWAKDAPDRKALLLTLNPVNPKGMHTAYWSDFAYHLQKYEKSSDLVVLLRCFLQEKKVAMSNIDRLNFLQFLAEELPNVADSRINPLKARGTFESVTTNLAILSTPFDAKLKLVHGVKRQASSIDHSVSSSVVGSQSDVLHIFAQHVLTDAPRHWRLRYGIELWGIGSDSMQSSLYASVWDNVRGQDFTKTIPIDFDAITTNASMESVKVKEEMHKLVSSSIQYASEQLEDIDICNMLNKLKVQFTL